MGLYNGLDALLGGLLPGGGTTPSTGWMKNMFTPQFVQDFVSSVNDPNAQLPSQVKAQQAEQMKQFQQMQQIQKNPWHPIHSQTYPGMQAGMNPQLPQMNPLQQQQEAAVLQGAAAGDPVAIGALTPAAVSNVAPGGPGIFAQNPIDMATGQPPVAPTNPLTNQLLNPIIQAIQGALGNQNSNVGNPGNTNPGNSNTNTSAPDPTVPPGNAIQAVSSATTGLLQSSSQGGPAKPKQTGSPGTGSPGSFQFGGQQIDPSQVQSILDAISAATKQGGFQNL